LLDWIIDVLIQLSYFAIPIAILLGSFGIPVPEEITLLIVGYLANIQFFDIKYVMILSFISMIAGDNLSYFLGYKGSHIVDWVLTATRLHWANEHFKKHPYKTIFITRFLSGLRVFFPIAAGSTRLPWKKFFIVDLLAVSILVPAFTLAGFYLAPHFDAIFAWILKIDKFILKILAAIIILSIIGLGAFKRILFGEKEPKKICKH